MYQGRCNILISSALTIPSGENKLRIFLFYIWYMPLEDNYSVTMLIPNATCSAHSSPKSNLLCEVPLPKILF
jgi:hypothetical protein